MDLINDAISEPEWMEKVTEYGNFRVWHLIFFGVSGTLSISEFQFSNIRNDSMYAVHNFEFSFPSKLPITVALVCRRSHNALLLLSISHSTYKARHRGGLSASQNSEKVSRALSKYQKLWNGRHGPAKRYAPIPCARNVKSLNTSWIRVLFHFDTLYICFFLISIPVFASSIGSRSRRLFGRITTCRKCHSSEKIKFVE